VCDFLNQHKQHIHEVALVGGEPLLLPENEKLLDVIPEDCIVTLITNMNQDLENNKVFKKLQKRKRVGWSMSFDNLGAEFEYVRHGGKWDLLLNNLERVKKLFATQGHWGGIHAVYNIYNATRICELSAFAKEQDIGIVWQNLFQPNYLDPFLHGAPVAELAAQEIERFYAQQPATDVEKNFFDQALTNYKSITKAHSNISQNFATHIQDIETKYHPDKHNQFCELWPELAFLIK
jgi:MoaA/NifB/PqqE/SkfB family radical SAM enzyme